MTWTGSVVRAPMSEAFLRVGTKCSGLLYPSGPNPLIGLASVVGRSYWMFAQFYRSPCLCLLFDHGCQLSSRADAGWHVASIESVTVAQVRSLFAAEHDIVHLWFHISRMAQDGCGVLVPLAAGVPSRVDYYRFSSSVLGCDLDSTPAYIVYQRSEEIDWYSVGLFPC